MHQSEAALICQPGQGPSRYYGAGPGRGPDAASVMLHEESNGKASGFRDSSRIGHLRTILSQVPRCGVLMARGGDVM